MVSAGGPFVSSSLTRVVQSDPEALVVARTLDKIADLYEGIAETEEKLSDVMLLAPAVNGKPGRLIEG